VPGEPAPDDAAGLRAANAWLREVIAAKDAEMRLLLAMASRRKARAVAGLGPGSLQSWAEDIIAVLAEAHRAVEDARARGDTALDPKTLDDLLERYDKAAAHGIIHNRLRDWASGTPPARATNPNVGA
jgi:hypothetical protein